MSAGIEVFLARLYTDAELRADFLRDRGGTAGRAGLIGEEVRGLLAIDEFALALTVRTFERKRGRRAPASAAPGHADTLLQNVEARVASQRRKLRIDAYEHGLRGALVRRTRQMRERLVSLLQRGVDLRHVIGHHVLRRRIGFEPLHDAERGLPIAADRGDVRAERQRL